MTPPKAASTKRLRSNLDRSLWHVKILSMKYSAFLFGRLRVETEGTTIYYQERAGLSAVILALLITQKKEMSLDEIVKELNLPDASDIRKDLSAAVTTLETNLGLSLKVTRGTYCFLPTGAEIDSDYHMLYEMAGNLSDFSTEHISSFLEKCKKTIFLDRLSALKGDAAIVEPVTSWVEGMQTEVKKVIDECEKEVQRRSSTSRRSERDSRLPHLAHKIARLSLVEKFDPFRHKISVITGIGGSGKSVLVSHILQNLKKDRVGDLGFLNFVGISPSLLQLTRELARISQRVTADFQSKIEVTEIEDWFPKNAETKYLVLENAHRILEKEGARFRLPSPIREFVQAVFASNSALRVILTGRLPELLEAVRDATGNVANTPSTLSHISMNYFNASEVEQFLGSRTIDSELRKSALEKAKENTEFWTPLRLTQLCFVGENDPQKAIELLQGTSLMEFEDAFYALQMQAVESDDKSGENNSRRVAFALSVVLRHETHRIWKHELFSFIEKMTCLPESEILAAIARLKHFGFLSEAKNDIKFCHDTARDFVYGKDSPSSWRDALRKDFHKAAADKYEELFATPQSSRTEWIHARQGALAVHHTLEIPDGPKAWDRLDKADRAMRAAFDFRGLEILRLKVGRVLTESGPIADNSADLAEVYYQGLDQWGDAFCWSQAVCEKFLPENKSPCAQKYIQRSKDEVKFSKTTRDGVKRVKFHTNQKVYFQAAHFLAIHAFECLGGEDGHKVPSNIAEDLRALEINDLAAEANLLCSLGVFYNRAENYDAATQCYLGALDGFEKLRRQQPKFATFVDFDLNRPVPISRALCCSLKARKLQSSALKNRIGLRVRVSARQSKEAKTTIMQPSI